MKRILSILLALALLCALVPAAMAEDIELEPVAEPETAEEPAGADAPGGPEDDIAIVDPEATAPAGETNASSGTCGDNLTWTLDDAGTLTISGTGPMVDYPKSLYADYEMPWYPQRESVRKIVIEPGVTKIGELAFWECVNVASVTIPDSLTSIGPLAFSSCKSLTELTIPASVRSIDSLAFHNCVGVKNIYFRGNAPAIADNSFELVNATAYYPKNANWPKLKRLNYGGSLTLVACSPGPTLSLQGLSTDGVALSWTAMDGAEKYELQRDDGSGWAKLKTVKTNKFTDETVQMGVTYHYCVQAYVNGAWSEYSPPLSIFFNPFSDISGTKTTKAICWALKAGVINSAKKFYPDEPISRIQIVMMLWKLAGSPNVTGDNPFTDVSGSKTTKAVLWAYKKGITKGTSSTTFSPDKPCTRVQLVIFLYKYNDIYRVI